MKTTKRIISIAIVLIMIAGICIAGTVSSNAQGTGVGLAEWALNAYYQGWVYQWGGATPGAVDCSGLIVSYCGGNRTSMLADAQAHGRDWGYVSSGIPRVHGLGLSRPGHVGVYVGNGMEVDARGTGYNMCYQAVGSSWSCWFKLTAVSYPTTGWEKFSGNYYYYENGEYLVNTSRTIDGQTYYFDGSGISSTTPSDMSATASSTDSSSSGSSSGSSSSGGAANDTGALKKGSQGARVEKLQTRLQELGYYSGPIDGDFGAGTEKAFKLFQKQYGLYVDGIAGSDADYLYADDAPAYRAEKKTEEKPAETQADEDEDNDLAETGENNESEAADEPKQEEKEQTTFQKGDYTDSLVPVQERLIALGYLDDDADGSFGDNTEAAVKSFQKANGLTVTGVIDDETYEMIFSNVAVKAAPKTITPDADAQVETTPSPAMKAAASVANTEVEKKTTQVSNNAIAGITDSIDVKPAKASTNFEFILWLGIMIVVMLITFAIVYSVEKKKNRAYVGKRFS